MSPSRPDGAVLFDLDGTLVDSAPDLLAALTTLSEENQLPLRLAQAELAGRAGQGARVLIRHGLGDFAADREAALLERFLALYAGSIWQHSRLYPGMTGVLTALAEQNWPLAVVTNKSERLARQLLTEAGLIDRFGCLIGGDTTAAPKPSPAPLLAACRALGVSPGQAVMVGDSEADILAARQAGCRAVLVRWGYAGAAPINDWQADAIIDRPDALLKWLESI
ncbi:MAG: phosphoglycolate phosphatase [Wenzhouxiangella sp.]